VPPHLQNVLRMILIHIRHLMKYKHVSTHIELMAHGAVTLLGAVTTDIRHSLWTRSNLIAIANVEPYSSSRSRDTVPTVRTEENNNQTKGTKKKAQ